MLQLLPLPSYSSTEVKKLRSFCGRRVEELFLEGRGGYMGRKGSQGF